MSASELSGFVLIIIDGHTKLNAFTNLLSSAPFYTLWGRRNINMGLADMAQWSNGRFVSSAGGQWYNYFKIYKITLGMMTLNTN